MNYKTISRPETIAQLPFNTTRDSRVVCVVRYYYQAWTLELSASIGTEKILGEVPRDAGARTERRGRRGQGIDHGTAMRFRSCRKPKIRAVRNRNSHGNSIVNRNVRF